MTNTTINSASAPELGKMTVTLGQITPLGALRVVEAQSSAGGAPVRIILSSPNSAYFAEQE